jgi:hypothetical protein
MAKFYYQPFAIFQANEIIFQLSLLGLHSFSIPAPPSTNQPKHDQKTKNKKKSRKRVSNFGVVEVYFACSPSLYNHRYLCITLTSSTDAVHKHTDALLY